MKLWMVFVLFLVIRLAAKKQKNNRRELCARSCYFRTVSHVAPIKMFGLVSIYIRHPRERMNARKYLSDMEAFQNLCWTYRDYTSHCLSQCPQNTLKKWLDKVFFKGLDSYCVKYYEDIINNWHCIQKLKRYRRLCDLECAGTCDPTCLFFCYRPVTRRICKNELPANILLEITELKSPQQNATLRHQPVCSKETISYNKIPTRVQ